jgi:hypothetical protein
MANVAGLVQQRKARQNGALVSVYRNAEAGLDDDGGARPFGVVCEDHSTVMACRTKRLAMSHAADPLGWCESCRAAKAAGHAPSERLVDCPGQAHDPAVGGNIDHCMVCLPRWGQVAIPAQFQTLDEYREACAEERCKGSGRAR